jgi:biotin synthesis protein BioG
MIAHWLYRDRAQKLILFCNGWGMDHHPLRMLDNGGHDVLVLSDYSTFELPVDLAVLDADYREINLVCWSFGVWAGPQLFGESTRVFTRRIGMNGTLRPIDDRFGIPRQFFNATLEQFSASVRDRFYRRMCRCEGALDLFIQNQPRRSLEDQEDELQKLSKLVTGREQDGSFFDTVIVASRDYIVPTAHQLAFWQGRCPIVQVESCHYPFAGWRSWAEIVALQN